MTILNPRRAGPGTRALGCWAALAVVGCVVFSTSADAALVILNEYNAVDGGSGEWLEADGLTASPKSDIYFGRIQGNGGDWFELVVVGDGTAGSTVDMRGWEIRIDEDGRPNRGHLKLSNHDYWATVTAGTILTFNDTPDADGQGIDTTTEILKADNLATEGWAWSNIYTDDPVYIDTADADHDPAFPVTRFSSQFVIFQPDGVTVVYGPAGEGISPQGGVAEREVFKLEADPSPLIVEASGLYTDGTSSSFGSPNVWSSGASAQSFAAFIVPEPSTMALLAAAALVMVLVRRRLT